MFWPKLKITKTKENFEIFNKKNWETKKFPLNFYELPKKQQQIVKRYVRASKIICFFFPFVYLIIYEIWNLATIFLVLFALNFILPADIVLFIALLTNLILWVFIVVKWAKLAYNAWSKRVLKRLYKEMGNN